MRKVGTKISIEECKLRAIRFMQTNNMELYLPSQITYAVWPEARQMRAQGAGLIGAKIMRQLHNEELIRWVDDNTFHGYRLTSKGRTWKPPQ